jgi:uncharacterized membrane protein
MADSTGEVKTVVGAELTGYIHKHKLAQFLKDLFGKEIKVFVCSSFATPRVGFLPVVLTWEIA